MNLDKPHLVVDPDGWRPYRRFPSFALRTTATATDLRDFFGRAMTTPGPLDAALIKLTDSIAAAESAIEVRQRVDAGAAAASAETVALESKLTELRREHAALKSVAGDVTRRLDAAIAQVEAILAGRD